MKQKVKKALSICGVDGECTGCPYNLGVRTCVRTLVNDISEVLQEDEKKAFSLRRETKPSAG